MYRQENKTNDLFPEEVRRLVTLAYPNASWEEQEEYAVEAFLAGLKHTDIAYDVMLKSPKTLAQAQEIVETAVHSYKLTVARRPKSVRRVTFEDHDNSETTAQREQSTSKEKPPSSPTDIKRLEGKMEEMFDMIRSLQNLAKSRNDSPVRGRFRDRNFRRSPSNSPQRDRSPSPGRRGACFYCKEEGHWKNECPVLASENEVGTALLSAKGRPKE